MVRFLPSSSLNDTDWLPDSRLRDIGRMNRENIRGLLPSLALYPFTQRLHMDMEHFERLMARAQEEVDTPSLKAYFPLWVPGPFRYLNGRLTAQICLYWAKAAVISLGTCARAMKVQDHTVLGGKRRVGWRTVQANHTIRFLLPFR